jgi:endoglucanase
MSKAGIAITSVRRRCMTGCAGILVLIFAGPSASAQNLEPGTHRPSCHSPAVSTVPPSRLARLARGFNLTGWLDGEGIRRPDQAVLANLHRRGFTHIRLPVAAERLMEAFSESHAIARHSAEMDAAIDSLIAIGFGVSLDLHPGNRLSRRHVADPERAFELIQALWGRLAQRYVSRPADRLFFEVLNEPPVDRTIWDNQGPRLVDAIRREAPDHTIIYGPANYQRIDALQELQPLRQSNVVYAVHFYDPMVFTHQGLDWSDDPLGNLRGVPFPAHLSDPTVARLLRELDGEGRLAAATLLHRQLSQPWNPERIANEIGTAAAWAKQHQRPVILNEFGVLRWKAPMGDRVRWLQAVRRSAEHYCIGWAHWDYADGFGFVRRLNGREVPDETLVRALLD